MSAHKAWTIAQRITQCVSIPLVAIPALATLGLLGMTVQVRFMPWHSERQVVIIILTGHAERCQMFCKSLRAFVASA